MSFCHVFSWKLARVKVSRHRLLRLSCLLLLLLPASFAPAEETAPQPFNFEKTQGDIKAISQKLKGGSLTAQAIEQASQQATGFVTAANACINAATGQIDRLDQEMNSLGPAGEHEPAETAKERKNLAKQKQAQQVTLSECRLTATLATRLQNELGDRDKLLQARSFFAKEDNFFDRFAEMVPAAADVAAQLKQYLPQQSGLGRLTPQMILILLALVATGAVAGWKTAGKLQFRPPAGEEPPRRQVPLAFAATLALLAGGLYLLFIIGETTPPAYGPWLLLSAGLYGFALFFYHLRNRLEDREVGQHMAIPAPHFRLLTLLCVTLFFITHLELADYAALASLLEIVRSVVVTAICLAGCWLVWALGLPDSHLRYRKPLRLGTTAMAAALAIIELSGYSNFSIFLLIGLLGTILLATLLRFALFFIDDIIGGLFEGKYPWQQRLRRKLGLPSQNNLMGITWIRLTVKLLAWSTAFLLFLQLWGLPDKQLNRFKRALIDGIGIGGLVVSPARILLGVFIFACGWTFVSWMTMQLEKKWLENASFSLSAKETLVTMTGYCGMAVAVILGLSVAGFSFSNLAVIAGALSVGIGFGMQNIVNNFVSGLIILFERPVKRGDWISIGNTQGYVQKISVRSTLIQTFDRSDVIVPNSELISNQVTNMTLHDKFGRIIVPVGVAYGSDTELVRTILMEIAAGSEEVVNDGTAPKPQVLFLAFGDNALQFELRCHLHNIDRRLGVKSEMNYAIDREFRKHGISMPFPQRDLYIKEMPGLITRNSEAKATHGIKQEESVNL
jgi:small-conductance mechanosensitive channel